MTAHYNPNTRTFDISLDNRFIAERLNRLKTMSNELGIDIQEDASATDLELAQEYVNGVVSNLGDYISQTDTTIESLSTRLAELKEYQDILESTLFDRLRNNKHIVLNKHVTARNMDQLYSNILDEITRFVVSEEGRRII